jgi:hypothetical protein
MKYVHIQWNHELPDAPTDVYSELDADRMEVRKIEMFNNQSIGFAEAGRSTENTSLRPTPLPYVSVLNQDPKAMARDLDWHEFDDLWEKLVRPLL